MIAGLILQVRYFLFSNQLIRALKPAYAFFSRLYSLHFKAF
ncbi:hypothetical protein OKW21_006403 [Catalinimonas alkaloidigena]|nr:hypothetical protein [Catalinimonas alkaloidigena]